MNEEKGANEVEIDGILKGGGLFEGNDVEGKREREDGPIGQRKIGEGNVGMVGRGGGMMNGPRLL